MPAGRRESEQINGESARVSRESGQVNVVSVRVREWLSGVHEGSPHALLPTLYKALETFKLKSRRKHMHMYVYIMQMQMQR